MTKLIIFTSLFLIVSCSNEEVNSTNKTEETTENVAVENENDGTSKTSNNKEMSNLSFYDFEINSLTGTPIELSQYKGKKILIVNTASECGLTPQYEQLQDLYDSLGGDKIVILGFPANNFGAQEPGSNDDIQAFCSKNFGVSFPMMAKISVKGEDAHPIYKWLIEQEKAKTGNETFEPLWNFHKFLIDENGNYVRQIHPETLPTDSTIVNWILS